MADPDADDDHRDGDPADDARSRAFADLLDAHGAAVMAMLRRLWRGGPDADDAFQETAARVWRHLAARPWYDPGSWLAPRPWVRNPRAWVMTIAYRAFVDARARRRRDHAALDGPADESVDGLGGDAPDLRGEAPDRLAERAEAHGRLRTAVAGLTDPVRAVVVLHYTGGLTIAQVAAATGLPGGTVKSRLNAGLAHLRAALAATDGPDGSDGSDRPAGGPVPEPAAGRRGERRTPMNCRDVLPAIAVGGPARRRRALRHAARCPTCAAALAEHRELTRRLAEAPPLTEGQRRQWLRAAAAERRDAAPVPTRRGLGRFGGYGGFGWRTAAAAVAAVVAVVWIAAAHRMSIAPPQSAWVDGGQSPPPPPKAPRQGSPPPNPAGPVPPTVVLTTDPSEEWARLSGGIDALDADLTRLRQKAERAEARRQVAAVLQQHGGW